MKFSGSIASIAICSVLLTGCQTSTWLTKVDPVVEQYSFIKDHDALSDHYYKLYKEKQSAEEKEFKLSAYIGGPKDYSVCFSGHSAAAQVGSAKKSDILKFKEGVYPFKLYSQQLNKEGQHEKSCDKLSKGSSSYSGAMVVYNLDNTVELATFGLSKETSLFDADLLKKVDSGSLANHEIKYDDKSRIYYWLGNRGNLYSGGTPVVELDFSGIKGISELTIDGKKMESNVIELDSYKPVQDKHGKVSNQAIEYKFSLSLSDGNVYQGYIRNLKDSEFTAFMRIPCTIPPELFTAASNGTIAKYDVVGKSSSESDETGDDSTTLAQLVFGLKR